MTRRIAFFGSSLLSAWWNGAATYYRGLLRALAERGHQVTFYEPDAWDRQAHRDIEPPPWARVVVYRGEDALEGALREARAADLVVKASGVGAFDDVLERQVCALRGPGRQVVYWDVDAPATLARLRRDLSDPLRGLIPRYDAVLTYGGGPPVIAAYLALGARRCVPIYNAHDPDTHHPVPPDPRFACALAFLANRLPDREERVERFFFDVARRMPDRAFLLGGNGWDGKPLPANVRWIGHVSTRDHNVLNASAEVVLNVLRSDMAEVGWSPATRTFEAAAAGACQISDRWTGLEAFFEPQREILLADGPDDVVDHLRELTPERRATIGLAARARVLADHTYAVRASAVERALVTSVRPASAAAPAQPPTEPTS